MTTASQSAVVNLIISLAGAICYFLVGWLWSMSTWRDSFDLGWLVVALILARYASRRIEKGRLKARDYLSVCIPVLPGFLFEFLANWGLHDFRVHDGFGALVRFAVFSCSIVVFVTVLTALLRFGVGLDVLSKKGEAIWNSTIRTGAAVMTVSFVAGTAFILLESAKGLHAQVGVLKSWLYCGSLMAYFLMTLKMMLPLVIRRLRAVVDQRNQPDMRF